VWLCCWLCCWLLSVRCRSLGNDRTKAAAERDALANELEGTRSELRDHRDQILLESELIREEAAKPLREKYDALLLKVKEKDHTVRPSHVTARIVYPCVVHCADNCSVAVGGVCSTRVS
jgi:hypothetical protein